jgi:hypothetical protein
VINADIPQAPEAPVFSSDPSPTGGMTPEQLLGHLYDASFLEELNEAYRTDQDYISSQPDSVFPAGRLGAAGVAAFITTQR